MKWTHIEKGIATLIYTKKDPVDINNYRPIILLGDAYKIRASVISTSLSPTVNLRTEEMQCAYKKSAYAGCYILYKKQATENKIKVGILLALSRDIDRVDRGAYGVYFTRGFYQYLP